MDKTMKVKELKEMLAQLGAELDDVEVFVSPMVETMMDVVGEPSPPNSPRQPVKTYHPSFSECYKMTIIFQLSPYRNSKLVDHKLIFGYDDLVNYSTENKEPHSDEEFIN